MDKCSNQEQQGTMCAGEPREINIRPLNHGYVVNIGCQTFAIESIKKLISNLEKYLNSPIETEKEWFSGNLLK